MRIRDFAGVAIDAGGRPVTMLKPSAVAAASNGPATPRRSRRYRSVYADGPRFTMGVEFVKVETGGHCFGTGGGGQHNAAHLAGQKIHLLARSPAAKHREDWCDDIDPALINRNR